MAFENLGNGFDTLLSAGKALDNKSFVDYMKVKDPKTSTVKAGYAISVDTTGTDGEQIPYDGAEFGGVNVLGTTDLGKQCEDVPNSEICTHGYIMVVLDVGQTAPKNGEFAEIVASGAFKVGAYASKVGTFTGKQGRALSTGELVSQLRF